MPNEIRFNPLPLPRSSSHAAFSQVAQENGVSAAAVDTLLEHLPDGVWIVDYNGRIVFENDAARALRVEGLEPLQWAITRALLTEEPVREDEIEIAVKGQPRRWLSAYIVPVRVPGRGISAALVTLSEVTARHRMRQWDPIIETLVKL